MSGTFFSYQYQAFLYAKELINLLVNRPITLLVICCAKYVANLCSVLIDIYCSCHNLCYFTAVYLYCLSIRYCFYHSLVNKDFHISYGTLLKVGINYKNTAK